MKTNPAPFRLFKSTSSANRCEYVGSVVIDGRIYAIEANVREHDRGDGTMGKHFEGQVFGGQRLVKQMLRGAQIDGKLPEDLVTLMEGTPFDDSLEGVGT